MPYRSSRGALWRTWATPASRSKPVRSTGCEFARQTRRNRIPSTSRSLREGQETTRTSSSSSSARRRLGALAAASLRSTSP